MKHPFVKIIICIIVTIILTIALALNTGAIISMNKEKRMREQAEASINNLSESFNYMVDIGGYRGQVQEIGVRSTKIMGQGNNVKIIGNRDVKNVLNLTRMNSWIPLEVKVSNSQPLEEIEALLDEQLPKIGKKIDKIVSGPYYYGVLGFDDNNIILSIMTECREEDYHHIQRELNKEMYNLFKSKKISVKNGLI